MACLEGGPVGAGGLAAGGGAPRPQPGPGPPFWPTRAPPPLDLSRRIRSNDPASCAQAIKGENFGEAVNPNFFSILLPSRHSHPAARKHRRLADGEPPFSLFCHLFSFCQPHRTSAAKELWFLANRALLLPLSFFSCRARPVLLFLKKMSMADRTCCSNSVFSFFPCLCFCAFSSIWPLVHWSTCSSFVTPLAIQPYASRSLHHLNSAEKYRWSWPFLVTLILISSLMYSIPLFCVNVCMRCVVIYGIEYGGLKRGCSSLCIFL
jgi:hypothetical protein